MEIVEAGGASSACTGAVQVAVVIPTYNRAGLVVEAIDSVLAQSLEAFELIVVDDGSTDGTAAALRTRYRQEPRLRVLTQPNGGTASARNVGLRAARAPYTGFLDSDDLWTPEFLRSQVEHIERSGADAVLCDALYEGGHHRGGSLFRDPWFVPPTSFANMLRGGWGLPSALLVRTSVGRAVGFNERFRFSEDTEFLLRFHAAGARCVLNPTRGSVYRAGRADSKTSGTWFEHLHAGVRMFHPHRGRRAARRRMRHFHYTMHRELATAFVRAGSWRGARPHLAACARHRPLRPRVLLRWMRSVVAKPGAATVPDALAERSRRVCNVFQEFERPQRA